MTNGRSLTSSRDDLTTGGSLRLEENVQLPEVLDVLIVGAGPAGTGAAFRAKELGLAALVIDRDEILSILRDWISPEGDPEKDKKVDSSYGPGGRLVPFPTGGKLVQELVYGDQVPAGEIYRRWMTIFVQNSVPARPNFELLGIQRGSDGILDARCVNLRTREEQVLRTHAVVLGMGRGVPHKIEMPGNTVGIHYRIRDAKIFVGGPACVVGGGTSAAEAVIAISNAKSQAKDESDVFWSYRRRNLPKVNSTLAEVFFQAYAGNGNIRYLPFSAPLAVLKHETGDEFVALRSDRREMPGRPPEGTYYEFPKERVLACIGADIPTDFLAELGILMLKSAETEENLMAVTRLFESAMPGVFMIGDLLSPDYIRTNDFSPDAVQTTVIEHIGNFKQGMTDGVLAVEAIRKRLDGAGEEEIVAHLDQLELEYKHIHDDRLKAQKAEKARDEEVKAQVAVAAPPEPEPEPVRLGAKFTRITYADGQELESEVRLFSPGSFTIGRTQGDYAFPDDEAVLENHAAILVEPDACYVSSEGMGGESFVDVRVERSVKVEDTILAGSYAFRIESGDDGIYLAAFGPRFPSGYNLPPLSAGLNTFGRTVIDERDVSMSRRHFSIQLQGNVLSLSDFGSLNHTYLKVDGQVKLYDGDELCVGNQRLRFRGMETGRAAVAEGLFEPLTAAARAAAVVEEAAPHVVEEAVAVGVGIVEEPAASLAPAPAPAAAPAVGPPAVTITNAEIGERIPLGAEETLLARLKAVHIAAHGKDEIGGRAQMLYSCERGDCGLCLFRVVSGMESLSPANPKEKKMIKKMVKTLNSEQGRSLQDASCRLACLAKATGPFEAELLGDTDA
jgi:thioredoxin reductase/ferredoxin/pSer/pThr/pTyr-binding forkhead associated (FHA) protein